MYVPESIVKLLQFPPIQAVAVLAGVSLAAALSRRLFGRVLVRLARGTPTELDDQMVAVLQRPIFWTLVLGGAAWAAWLLDPSPAVRYWGSGVLLTVLTVLWTVALTRLVVLVLHWLSVVPTVKLVQPRLLPLFDNVARVLVVGGAIYVVLLSWDVDVAAWVASAGILGIAVGFAARDTLANLFAGIFILTDSPYKLGDYIVLEDGQRGRVTDIGIRSSRILTRDDIEITIPNNVIGNSRIINESGGPWEKERLRVPVEVAYGSDIDRVRAELEAIAADEREVGREPPPHVRFREFGESGLRFELLCWIDRPEDHGRILDALNTAVYKRFNREGIEFPYPKRDLYIKEWPALPFGEASAVASLHRTAP